MVAENEPKAAAAATDAPAGGDAGTDGGNQETVEATGDAILISDCILGLGAALMEVAAAIREYNEITRKSLEPITEERMPELDMDGKPIQT